MYITASTNSNIHANEMNDDLGNNHHQLHQHLHHQHLQLQQQHQHSLIHSDNSKNTSKLNGLDIPI